jgi:hypothetical protein
MQLVAAVLPREGRHARTSQQHCTAVAPLALQVEA